MSLIETDIMIIGAGPVGLLSAYLASQRGLRTVTVDKSSAPLQVGRADALNARTLQLLELAGLFGDLYPHGKICNTSSVWGRGGFISRQSKWWDEIQGCLHKHFLMIGQAHVEKLIDGKLSALGAGVRRETSVEAIELGENGCETLLSSGERVRSKYVIGADGSRSFVRDFFKVPFTLERPQMVWAVIDGVIDSDFPKVPEIINFQADTSDVAWIPREGDIDRFYVRMDSRDFTFDDAVAKINRAMAPHTLRFSRVEWQSQFSVKESVAENFMIGGRVFLAGDACHVHSVNGGQGLNTGLADAFNLIWKISEVERGAPSELLATYETERKPVALSVIETSGELVRATKVSASGGASHAEDYVKIVEKRAGNITGMGIRYGAAGIVGSRVWDQEILQDEARTSLYSMLDYRHYTLLVYGDRVVDLPLPAGTAVIRLGADHRTQGTSAELVRPDSYIAAVW